MGEFGFRPSQAFSKAEETYLSLDFKLNYTTADICPPGSSVLTKMKEFLDYR